MESLKLVLNTCLANRTELGTAGLNDHLPPDRGGQTVPAGDGRVGGSSSRPEHHAGRERPGGTAQKSLTRDLCQVFRHIGHLCRLKMRAAVTRRGTTKTVSRTFTGTVTLLSCPLR